MKKKILSSLFLTLSMVSFAKSSEPVLMTVNGENIPVAEFQYLYNKNNQQQLEPQTVDEYLQMFEIYRLKVADAKAEGKDTTASFRAEMAQYRNELMQPFLADSAFIYDLIDIAAQREKEEIEVNHIMMLKSKDIGTNLRSHQLLDSLRTEIEKGKNINELAKQYSQDRSVETNSGYLGFISAGRFPYAFETAVYETPEGSVSEIVESPVGYHIVVPGKRRPSRGKIQASHIMRMVPKGASPEVEERQKFLIDSIYQVVTAHPESFGEVAKRMSDDKNSGRQEGRLPEFGSGEMVPEFENAAFALEVGEISKPVRSGFGWHIIKKTGAKASRDYNEIKEETLKRISNPQDGRSAEVRKHTINNLKGKHHASLNPQAISEMKRLAREKLDSEIYANWTQIPQPVATVGGKPLPASRIAARLSGVTETRPEVVDNIIDAAVEAEFETFILETEEDWEYAYNPEYRNLINEYTDGSMLYEVSVEKVWDRASKDQEGLENYFNAHKEKYKWEQPYAKGVLIQVINDSIGSLIKEEVNGMSPEEVAAFVKNRYSGKAIAEKFLVPKGVNAMVDNVMFGGKQARPKNKMYKSFIIVDGRLLQSPEEMSDVRGAVTSDYQEQLEAEWVSELKRKYPVSLNKKEFNKLKKTLEKEK